MGPGMVVKLTHTRHPHTHTRFPDLLFFFALSYSHTYFMQVITGVGRHSKEGEVGIKKAKFKVLIYHLLLSGELVGMCG